MTIKINNFPFLLTEVFLKWNFLYFSIIKWIVEDSTDSTDFHLLHTRFKLSLHKWKTNALGHQNFEYFFVILFLIGLIPYRVTEGRNFSFGMVFLSAFEVKISEIK